jgi:DNA invertase Pin-like site-specific DNA recombinase
MPAHQGKFVAYFRVSTDKQGKSGLGLEAQREAVRTYLDGGRWSLVQEFVEVESGKHNDRPGLTAALAACKKHKAKLIIAKLAVPVRPQPIACGRVSAIAFNNSRPRLFS